MFSDLVQTLSELHQTQRTGLLIINVDNRLVTISFVAGEIVCWFYNRVSGMTAVEAFVDDGKDRVADLKWNFRKGPATDHRQTDLPSFDVLLKMLDVPSVDHDGGVATTRPATAEDSR